MEPVGPDGPGTTGMTNLTEKKGSSRNVFFISMSQFWVNFSFNFMFAFLPFYMNKISPYSPQQTLLWTGLIFGATSMCVAFSGPFWGSLTHRISPKLLYLSGMTIHCLTFIVMAFTTSVPLLLVLRILQGVFGGTATIGLIMISFSGSAHRPRDIGIFQSSITLGQLIGPPLGTLAVTAFGYSGSFLSAAVVLGGTSLASYFFIDDVVCERTAAGASGRRLSGRVLVTWLLCLVAQVQLMFLPAILPDVFRGLQLDQKSALHWAGLLITLYTITSMAGTYVWSSLAPRVGVHRTINLLMLAGIVMQALLIFPTGITGYTAIRMIQTGLIAAVIPLALALFAGNAGGLTLGFLYSSRFVGNAVGPVMATSLVAFWGIPALYVSVCVLSLATLVIFWFAMRAGERRKGRANTPLSDRPFFPTRRSGNLLQPRRSVRGREGIDRCWSTDRRVRHAIATTTAAGPRYQPGTDRSGCRRLCRKRR